MCVSCADPSDLKSFVHVYLRAIRSKDLISYHSILNPLLKNARVMPADSFRILNNSGVYAGISFRNLNNSYTYVRSMDLHLWST